MNWEKVSELFEQATEQTAGAEREAFLVELAVAYPEESAEVRGLLEAEADMIPMYYCRLRNSSSNFLSSTLAARASHCLAHSVNLVDSGSEISNNR